MKIAFTTLMAVLLSGCAGHEIKQKEGASLPPVRIQTVDVQPAEWTVTAEDPHPIRSGSPGLYGYSPVDIHYDNVKVTVNAR